MLRDNLNCLERRFGPEPVEISAADWLNPTRFLLAMSLSPITLADGAATRLLVDLETVEAFSQPPALRFQSIAMPSVRLANA
jgi:hypothetical protein